MKIAYCFDRLTALGGIERVTIIKANALAARGHHVTIITIQETNNNELVAEPLSKDVHTECLKLNFFYQVKKWTVSNWLHHRNLHRRALQEWIDREQPDILVSTGSSEKHILPFLRLSKGNHRTHIIREVHFQSDYRKYNYRWFSSLFDFIEYRLLAWNIDTTILLTKFDLENIWKGNPNKTQVIYNPVTISPKMCDTTQKRVVAVGRLDKQKDYSTLVKAFSIVVQEHPDWTLDIYGDGNEKQLIETLIKDLNCQNNIFLKGRTNDVSSAMSTASILAHSAVYEGFCLTMLEGMACGLPIVSTDCHGNARELFGEDLGCCRIVPIKDFRRLAQELNELISSPQIRKEMGNNSLANVKRFRLDKIIDQWECLFRKITSKK